MTSEQNRNLKNTNLGNVFWRTLLGMLFLYLNFAAYQLLGIEGVAVTSVFFLVAQFAPFILRIFAKRDSFKFSQGPEVFTEPGGEKQSAKVIPIRLITQAEHKST